MPCSGTVDKLFVFEEVLNNIQPWIQTYPYHTVVFGGNINSDLDAVGPVSDLFNHFAADNFLTRCDQFNSNLSVSGNKRSRLPTTMKR